MVKLNNYLHILVCNIGTVDIVKCDCEWIMDLSYERGSEESSAKSNASGKFEINCLSTPQD